jgi:Protein of unknown function (DUF2848)
MHQVTFEFRSKGHSETRSVPVRDLVIAGWTGRDMHKVQEHIEELAALGVAPPPSVPCFYRASTLLLTTEEQIDFLGAESSGEAEYFLLLREDGWWVGAGSDHTDRKVEAYSITVSKQMCPKPVAPVLWRFEEMADHWDRLEILSEIDEGKGFVPYQQGSIAAMRDPRDLIARYEAAGLKPGPDTLMFGGTLPVIGGIRPCAKFRFSLHDPVRGETIRHAYTARFLPN